MPQPLRAGQRAAVLPAVTRPSLAGVLLGHSGPRGRGLGPANPANPAAAASALLGREKTYSLTTRVKVCELETAHYLSGQKDGTSAVVCAPESMKRALPFSMTPQHSTNCGWHLLTKHRI